MDTMRALQVFQAVIRHHSFSAGARELGMSTTSVSRIVAELENSLGARLLNRTTRTFSVTETGLLLYDRAKNLLNDLDDLKGSINVLSQTVEGSIRVTCPVSFGAQVLMPLLPSFLAAHPKITVEASLTNRYLDLIEEGYDVAIRQGDEKPSTMIARKLGAYTTVLATTPQYIERCGRPLKPGDLAQHQNVVYRSAHQTNNVYVLKSARGQETTVRVAGSLFVDSTDGMRAAVLAGCGVGQFPRYSIAAELADDRLIDLFPHFTIGRVETFVMYPHRRHLSQKIRTFVDHLVRNVTLA